MSPTARGPRVLIAGALGHIGSRLIRALPALVPGAEVWMVDNLSAGGHHCLFNLPAEGRYRFRNADVLRMDAGALLREARPEVVVNLVAITNAPASFRQRRRVQRVNLSVVERLAAACAEQNVPLVHISTTSVYGAAQGMVDETVPTEDLHPESPYAQSKLQEEAHLRELGERAGLSFAVCRFCTTCGPSPGMHFHTAANKFCWQAVMGEPITVWRTALHQVRPYVTLTDAVGALGFLIRERVYDRRVYNVATANLTVSEVLEQIRAQGLDTRVKLVDAQIMNRCSYEVSTARIEGLGFRIRGSVPQALAETIDLLRAAGGRPPPQAKGRTKET